MFSKTQQRRVSPKKSLASQIVTFGLMSLTAGYAVADCNHFDGTAKQINNGGSVVNSISGTTYALGYDHARKHGVKYTSRPVSVTKRILVSSTCYDSNGDPYTCYNQTSTSINYDEWDVANIIDTGSGGAYSGTDSGHQNHEWGGGATGSNDKTDETVNGVTIAPTAGTPTSNAPVGSECTLSHDYSPISHDAGNGRVEVTSGTTTLKGDGKVIYSGLDTRLEGATTDSTKFVVKQGSSIISNPASLTLVQTPRQSISVKIDDPSLPGNKIDIVIEHDPNAITYTHPAVEGAKAISGYTNYVGDMQYIDMKLGTAAGGTLNVNLDGITAKQNRDSSGVADDTGNTVNLNAKQTILLKASNGGTVEWQGNEKNKWYFGRNEALNFTASGSGSINSFVAGTRPAGAIIRHDGTPDTINTQEDLRRYGQWLLDEMRAGKLNYLVPPGTSLEAGLNAVFNDQIKRAITGSNSTYTVHSAGSSVSEPTNLLGYTTGGGEATFNDGNKQRGDQIVMKAEGAGSTVKLGDNANLVTSHYQEESATAGAMVITGAGAEGIVAASAKLSGFGSLVTVSSEGTFSNSGKITAGSADSAASGNNLEDVVIGRQHGFGVRVLDGGKATNETSGVINVTSTGSFGNTGSNSGREIPGQPGTSVGMDVYAMRSEGGNSLINKGVINVSINDSVSLRDQSHGILVRKGKLNESAVMASADVTTVENHGTINIGKAKDGDRDGHGADTSVTDRSYGIRADSKIGLTLKDESLIKIAQNVENAIGVFLNGGDDNASSTIAGSTYNLEKGSLIAVHGSRDQSSEPGENVGLQAKNTADDIVYAKGNVDINGKNAIGLDAVGNAKIHVGDDADPDAGKIVVDGGSVEAGRNIGVRAYSAGPNNAEIKMLGESKITLKGNGSIGIYGKGFADINIGPKSEVVMDPTSANARNQIGYYLHGPKANLNFEPNDDREFNVATEDSVMFRMDEGAAATVTGLKIKTDGKNSTAIVISRKSRDAAGNLDGERDSNFDIKDGIYRLTGEGSTFIKVDGGAKAEVDGASQITLENDAVRIGIVDGRGYHLNDSPDQRSGMPADDSILTSYLSTEVTKYERINTYITRTNGLLNFRGSYINLYGNDSNAFRMEDGGRLEVAESASFRINGDFIQSHNANSHYRNTIDYGRTNVANLERNNVEAINVLNARSGKIEVETFGQSLLTGAALTDKTANSRLRTSEETVWNITDNSTLTNFNNRGTVNFVAPISNLKDKSEYDTLVINQHYLGQGGSTISVNSNWYEPNDLYTNSVLIKGNAYGRTRVIATDGIGGDVQAAKRGDSGDGYELISENLMQKYDSKTPVITVLGQDNYDKEGQQTFVGEAAIRNSGLVAQLLKKGKSYYWTLTHELPAIEREEVKPIPLYVREAAAYLQTPFVNREMGLDLLGKVNERAGEQQFDCNCIAPQSWSRLSYTDSYHQGKERFAFGSKRGLVQFGQDVSVNVNETRRVHTGVMAGYSWSNNRFYDKYSSENGIVKNDKETLGSKSQVASLGAYRTAYFNDGSYLDFAVNGNYIHNQYRTDGSQRLSQDGYGAGASVEFGRLFPMGESNWYVQPQAQLKGQYLRFDNLTDSVRTTKAEDSTSVQGRIGARVTNGTFYVAANIVHDILAPKAKVTMGTTGLEERYNPTTADLAVGGDIGLDSARKWQLYGDLKYSRALAKTNNVFTNRGPAESYSGRLGIRYSW